MHRDWIISARPYGLLKIQSWPADLSLFTLSCVFYPTSTAHGCGVNTCFDSKRALHFQRPYWVTGFSSHQRTEVTDPSVRNRISYPDPPLPVYWAKVSHCLVYCLVCEPCVCLPILTAAPVAPLRISSSPPLSHHCCVVLQGVVPMYLFQSKA